MTSLHSDVSRETLGKLADFERLVLKWNRSINLVARSTLQDLWSRHIGDSLALVANLKNTTGHWVDLGSGGGFPGIVAAIATDDIPECRLTLIESDARKCVFLRTAIRELGLTAHVINARIEDAKPQAADILSARALSNLTNLLKLSERHIHTNTRLVFPKGVNWRSEVDVAKKHFDFSLEVTPSLTHEGSVTLMIQGVSRV